jgi:hypothetical protein
MLASDLFAEDHCFRITSSPDPARIGISFEPTADRRRIPEIAGTLWLDRTTSELRAADFHYVNVDRLVATSGAGGSMQFIRMANGAWVITSWSIRMPVMERKVTVSADRYSMRSESRAVFTVLKEVGGELALSQRGGDTLWTHAKLLLTGTVVDSATGSPASGARITLMGTDARDVADTAGRFSLSGVLPGDYTLAVHTTSLDSLHAVQQAAVTLTADSPPIRVRVASAQDVAAAFCRAAATRTAGRLQGILIGTVDAVGDASAQANLRVVAEWIEGPKHEQKGLVTRTDGRGSFRFCGVPINIPIGVHASGDSAESLPAEVTIAPPGRFALVPLTLDPSQPGTAVFTGIVADSAGQPITGVEVAFPKLHKSLLTGEAGAFRLREIPLGPQELVVRKIGWGPLDTSIAFSARDTVNRRIVLVRVTTLEAVETTAEGPWLHDFEENRRVGLGHFFTRADIEREKPLQTAHLLSATSGLLVIRPPRTTRAYVVSSRGPKTLTGVNCGPSRLADVYLDNVPIYAGRPGDEPFDVNSIDPSTIAGIEFYASAAQTPARYQNLNTVCGVLVIWTRR